MTPDTRDRIQALIDRHTPDSDGTTSGWWRQQLRELLSTAPEIVVSGTLQVESLDDDGTACSVDNPVDNPPESDTYVRVISVSDGRDHDRLRSFVGREVTVIVA